MLKNNTLYQFICEFSGSSKEDFYDAFDLISNYKMCLCPKRIKAYHTLGINIGIDIYKFLNGIKEVIIKNLIQRIQMCGKKLWKNIMARRCRIP